MIINGRVLPCKPKPRKALPCSAAETTTKSRGGWLLQANQAQKRFAVLGGGDDDVVQGWATTECSTS
jgi:hypothetical protein